MPVGTQQGYMVCARANQLLQTTTVLNLNLQEHELPAVCEEYNLAVVLALPGHP